MNRILLCSTFLVILIISASALAGCNSRCSLKGKVILKDMSGKDIPVRGSRVLLIRGSVVDELQKTYPWWSDDIYRKMLESGRNQSADTKPWLFGMHGDQEARKERDRQINELLSCRDQLITVSFLGDFDVEGTLSFKEWCGYWREDYNEEAVALREDAEFCRFITKFLLDSAELFKIVTDSGEQLATLCRRRDNYSGEHLARSISGEYQKYLLASRIKAEQYQKKAEEQKARSDEAKALSQRFERLNLALDADIDLDNFCTLVEFSDVQQAFIKRARQAGELSKTEEMPQWFSRSIRAIKAPFQRSIEAESTVEDNGSFNFRDIPPGQYYLIIPSLRVSGVRSFLVKRIEVRRGAEKTEMTKRSLYRSEDWGVYRAAFAAFIEDPIKKIASGEHSLSVYDDLIRIDPGIMRTRDHRELTILHHCAMKGRIDVADLLISNGAPINAQSGEGETPLHCAVKKAVENRADVTAFDMAALIIDRGADINARNKEGLTALHEAVYSRSYPSLVELLLKKGADVNARTEKGDTALHFAARCNSAEVIKALISGGADVAAENNDGESPLAVAEMFRRKEIADLLKAETEKKTREKRAGDFYSAVNTSNLGKVREYLSSDPWLAKWKYQDKNGVTPLHCAAEQGNIDIMKILISKGATVGAKDANGITPLQNARKAGEKEAEEYLKEQGAAK
jgi:ankyrin repeat protein